MYKRTVKGNGAGAICTITYLNIVTFGIKMSSPYVYSLEEKDELFTKEQCYIINLKLPKH